ncbi:type ISP restriction/modification enzyme [Candidatus Albibeggiatoa sp. nov. BB20]|uniref:DEAD/DEAH box helicase n=1 Tax=Candidatus Albibeggiatoa sp. nov. BB20 TaxID=3162723 RepID=UPI0033657787
MTTLQTLLADYRKNYLSEREKGTRFERLMQAYLQAESCYKSLYKNVWLWDEWEGRKDWEGHRGADKGIDLVAQEYSGEYCAIQCKFYNESSILSKKDIDSFFTESGKQPFSQRLIISTTDNWSKHAESALEKQHTPVSRIGISDLENSPIDWSQFSWETPEQLALKPKKQLRPHQKKALDKVLAGFKTADRGKLIMACGTGKTFTSLKIAERIAGQSGFVLFLVPSISLLSQTLREWSAEVSPDIGFNSLAVCSDSKVNKTEDIHVYEIGYPATTDPSKLAEDFNKPKSNGLTVIFSTYQSIQVISEAQQQYNLPEFDLILCDEAHRTTGATFAGKEESNFVRVHDQDYIQAKKRLYMTATPRLYEDSVKTKAQQADTILCSMDDESLYGHEFHYLGFGEAVEQQLLSDYKVMILAVDEAYVSKEFQEQLSSSDYTLDLQDAARLVGCWNGLAKRLSKDSDDYLLAGDTSPMRRAVAFCKDIETSKQVTKLFEEVINKYHNSDNDKTSNKLNCKADHVDGSFNALKRNKLLNWLKEEPEENTCHILTNARCLSEGVDVPALDAVMFLNPRNSQVDVVQSVGRVMRKAEGKQYGYIILPVAVSAGVPPEIALEQDKQRYKVVWSVLQALRSHDERFEATINKLELNEKKPDSIQVIGITGEHSDDGGALDQQDPSVQHSLQFPNIDNLQDAIYAKIVAKCGKRLYWEMWAKDIAQTAEQHITDINNLLEDTEHKTTFDKFLKALQTTLNPAISQADAVEMLAQHLITKPVFDALFDDYDFAAYNPVSQAMQSMLDTLQQQVLDNEADNKAETLVKFYDSVKRRAQDIDNAESKQKIIIELYDKFFRTAFPRMAERLGIVYTPIEVVDFIIQSVDVALKQEFNQGLTDKDVHILDPFTGTGTFMVQLIQSGLIKPSDLARKFKHELHANELVLLAYYIAAVNIEAAYHGAIGGDYVPFEGIVLTDTFQMTEDKKEKDYANLKNKAFIYEGEGIPGNSKRAKHQNQQAIQVVIGNPPYSAGQGSQNDDNQNVEYSNLDNSIRETYADKSKSGNVRNLYDSYIRAIRWASNRIQDKGVIGFVTNGSFIDSNNMDGLRQCLSGEFSAIYVFNLRGNQRTSGETSRKEGGKIFGSGSRAPIAITLLVKNPSSQAKQATIYYHDIGDYLSQKDKLDKIKAFSSIDGIDWQTITPNESQDWINQRNTAFDTFTILGEKKKQENQTVFKSYSLGLTTSRDSWCYSFSKQSLSEKIQSMIVFYNQQLAEYKRQLEINKKMIANEFVDNDATKISWSRGLKYHLSKLRQYEFLESSLFKGLYRPFCKQYIYFNRVFNEYVYIMPRIFPKPELTNKVICVTGRGATKDFSALISNTLPDYEMISKGQCFPIKTYEKAESQGGLFASADEYTEQDNISDETLQAFRKAYPDQTISKEDIFYYVYGVLHSPEYKTRFASNLKKQLPRIPYAADFQAFHTAGRKLAEWHLNYEAVEPHPVTETSNAQSPEHYRVQKMKFGKNKDKTTITYNSYIILNDIPLKAYEYIVNGKPAIEWIMDSYQVKTDKASGIKNDSNDWSQDPRYILDLLKRIITVSLESVEIVESLPPLNEKN